MGFLGEFFNAIQADQHAESEGSSPSLCFSLLHTGCILRLNQLFQHMSAIAISVRICFVARLTVHFGWEFTFLMRVLLVGLQS
jgi:hypothetical protein